MAKNDDNWTGMEHPCFEGYALDFDGDGLLECLDADAPDECAHLAAGGTWANCAAGGQSRHCPKSIWPAEDQRCERPLGTR